MEVPKVSLVFPCWHATKHLEHVLADLQTQTFKDFEAIFVNDGDDSQMEAMKAIAAQDSRIHIVNLPQNSGVAAARNAGTDAATTEWVTYPDPDDRFGANYVKSLYEAVDGTGVEMACGGYTMLIVDDGGIYQQYIEIEDSPKVMDIAAGYEQMISPTVFTFAWNKLYNVEIIRNNNLRQDSHFEISQDYAFNMHYFLYCKKVGLVRDSSYIYYYYGCKSNSKRFHPYYFQYRLEIIGLREQFHRYIGWQNSRVLKVYQEEISTEAFNYLTRFYAYGSKLSLRKVANEIKKNYLSQPSIVNAVKKTDPGNDLIKRLFRFLTKLGSSYTMAVTFRMMFAVRSRFATLYARKRNLLRGDI